MPKTVAQEIIVTRPGGHRVLEVRERQLPPLKARQVLVDVAACGVNFADICVRLGVYSAVKKYPVVPGFEFAGVITAAGEQVRELKAGDRVFGITRFGGYASRILVDEDYVWPCPRGLSLEQCAAFPAVYLTAEHAARRVARVEKGEAALIQSAAGGMGLALTQILSAGGLKTAGVVSSAEKADLCRRFGIGRVVIRDGGKEWSQLEGFAPKGYDVIFDANGGPSLLEGYRRLAPSGRLVVYGAAQMLERGESKIHWLKLAWKYLTRSKFDPLAMITDNKGVLGFNVVYLFHEKERVRAHMRNLLELLHNGKIMPLPVRSFPFEQAAEAHRAIESGQTSGKLVLRVREES
ncbi:MAG: zinc-binding dehydrogenase [Elusimicrobia bacterium]|nr:zinc-binding dehydrogenase [Elusimicrobiota bacterium]